MKINRVEPAMPMLSMTWMIGSRCNYACSYCPDELHDDTSPHPDLNKLVRVWQNFYSKTQQTGLPYKISFTGGEVTTNKSFLPLLHYLRSEYDISQIVVTTNGSASTAYYEKLARLVDAISFSVHSEYWDEQKFFSTVVAVNKIMVRPDKSCHVNIMDEEWNRENFPRYQKFLLKHSISHSINLISDETPQL